MNILHELKERRLAQYAAAYAATGWVALEVIDQLVGNEILPALTYPVALTLFICGIPGVLIVTWFHGARGDQKAPAVEKLLLTSVALIALGVSGYVIQRDVAARAAEAAPLENLDPTEDPRRVAVLYFEGRGAPEGGDFLAAGLTESLIDELSSVDVLSVVSRNGSAMFRGRPAPADSIGRTLQVGTLVEGTVTETAERVRVDVSLVRAATGKQFASTRLERPRAELLELQDDLAAEVALFLREELGAEIHVIAEQAETDDVEAWELYHRAEDLAEGVTALTVEENLQAAARQLDEADSLLARAERRDPDWVRPPTQRGWLAYRRSRLGGLDRSNLDLIQGGMVHAQRALALDPQNPDALELRATLQYWRYLLNLVEEPGQAPRLFAAAEADFEASVAANPAQASAWTSLAHLRLNKGETAAAKLAALRAYETDPYLRNANLTLWRLFSASLDLGDGVEAASWCREGLRRFPDDFRFRECQVQLYALPGQTPDIDHAWQVCDELVQLSPLGRRAFDEKRCQVFVGMALVRAGLADSARAVLLRARAGPELDPVRELSNFEAMARSWLGDMDEAFELLAEFLAANPAQAESIGQEDSWWTEDLRADPRFQTLLKR